MCSATKAQIGRADRSCLLLHLQIRSTESSTAMLPSPLLLSATEVSTQQQCAEVQNPENLPPLHIPTCVQRADPSKMKPTAGTVLVEILSLPIVASELAGIPPQPPTVVSTCPAHAFHPDAHLN